MCIVYVYVRVCCMCMRVVCAYVCRVSVLKSLVWRTTLQDIEHFALSHVITASTVRYLTNNVPSDLATGGDDSLDPKGSTVFDMYSKEIAQHTF